MIVPITETLKILSTTLIVSIFYVHYFMFIFRFYILCPSPLFYAFGLGDLVPIPAASSMVSGSLVPRVSGARNTSAPDSSANPQNSTDGKLSNSAAP